MRYTFFIITMLLCAITSSTQISWAISITSTYTYDDINRLTSVSHSSGLDLSYSYDPAGNILNVSGGGLQNYNPTLSDVIKYLQVVAGDNPANINIYHDIDHDGRVGLPEALYSLQYIASDTLQEGLVAHYQLDGNGNDESGNGNHGNVTGATPSTDRFGNESSAYSFDGIDDCFDAETAVFKTQPFSIQVWFRTDSYSINSMVNYVNINQYYGWTIRNQYPDKSVIFFTNAENGATLSQLQTNLAVNNNFWHHIIVTDDGTSRKLYVDGGLVDSSASQQVLWTSPMYLYLGASRPESSINPKYWFNGALDDIRIYNRAISALEVQKLYRATQ